MNKKPNVRILKFLLLLNIFHPFLSFKSVSEEEKPYHLASIRALSRKYKRDRSNRIEYILEVNLLEKSVKRPFCCTVSILQVYFTYLCYITFWALEHNFIEENQIMK